MQYLQKSICTTAGRYTASLGDALCQYVSYCVGFEWGRPYRFKEHLKKRHPNVDPDAVLDEATNIHRRATTIRRYPLQTSVYGHSVFL